jgi:hypothetical protein
MAELASQSDRLLNTIKRLVEAAHTQTRAQTQKDEA